MEDIIFWIWLSFFELNPVEKKILLECFSPEELYRKTKEEIKIKVIKSKKINQFRLNKILEEVSKKEYRIDLDKKVKRLKKENIEVITINDKKYPNYLKTIYDPPILFFIKGNSNLLKNEIVSILGTDNSTEYGRKIAYRLSKRLSSKNITILPLGLNNGIDTYSYIGALENRGKSISVLPCGLNMMYEKESKKIIDRILKNDGLILSEYYLDKKISKEKLIMKNRIVYGLAQKVLVIEAEKESFILNVVSHALDEGRDIYAVPGKINEQTSSGTNELIKEGAYSLLSIEDII